MTSCGPLSNVWFPHLHTEDAHFLDLFEGQHLNELVYVRCLVKLEAIILFLHFPAALCLLLCILPPLGQHQAQRVLNKCVGADGLFREYMMRLEER